MTEEQIWYRVDAVHAGDGAMLYLLACKVLKETPKGVWLGDSGRDKRFVLRDAKKRWACPTKVEALESFCARKTQQIRYLKANLWFAEKALRKGDLALYYERLGKGVLNGGG